MPAITRRAAKAAASSSDTEALQANHNGNQTPIAAGLGTETFVIEDPTSDDIHIAILAMVKAVLETTALNEALIADIDFEAEGSCMLTINLFLNFLILIPSDNDCR